MFSDPTIDDFRNWIKHHLQKALDRSRKSVGQVASEASARGAYHSSARIFMTLDAAHKQFDAGIEAALGELKRAIKSTRLDKHELRKVTEEELREFGSEIRIDLNPEKSMRMGGSAFMEPVEKSLAEFDEKLVFSLRQFDVGFFDPEEPEDSPMSHSIKIGSMTGGAIQQGTVDSSQNVTLNVGEIRHAVEQVSAGLSEAELPADALATIQADLDTIKAQLSKPEPSQPIIAEAAKSLRGITEGVTAGLITPGVHAAITQIGKLIGAN